MPTTLTNGIQLPDKGSVDWYSSMQSNYNLIDTHLGDTDVHVTAEDKANWNSKQGSLSQAQLDAIAQVATNTDDIATLQSGKANASHTHSSSDITDIDDYATKDYVDNSISGLVDNAPDALNTLNELSAALNDDSNFATTVTNALANKADSADLATVATSGSYTDLTDKPTIPTNTSDLTNDSDFVVSSNLATIATSGDYDDLSNKPSIPTNTSDLNNDSGFITSDDLDIPTKTSDLTNDSGFITSSDVPTSTSDLINDSNFVDTSNSAVSSGITSAKVTDYDSHIADTDIHVTTADKNKWNNGVSQAYVFRYSSTALVASSTNSNTLLDNTDNLKVGDKVIDSDGVIYSVTTIDTANSTFTVGSALIDLALDANVVHTSGNETVGGQKIFTNSIILQNSDTSGLSRDFFSKSQVAVLGDTVNGDNTKYRFVDKNDNEICYIRQRKLTNSNTDMSFCVNNIDNDNNSISAEINFVIDRNNDPRISPTVTDSISLGRPNFRWKSIYSNSYYYGNVEFSTKFVTTDTAQTISGGKTFSSPTRIYNASATVQADVPSLVFKNSLVERASTTLDGEQTILFTDKNDNNIGSIQAKTYTSGISDIILTSYSEYDGVKTTGIMIRRTPTTSKLQGYSDNITDLGDTNRRWRRVYATNYYYGSDNVEFSTKFVTTDTNQTIAGEKTFSSSLRISNSDTTVTTPDLNLKNYKADRGTTDTAVQAIQFLDKNGKALTSIESRRLSNGNTATNILCYNTDDSNNTVSGGVAIIKTKTETTFAPNADNAVICGRALAKWSDVVTYKVNGLEPSSLSLPSDRSARIDISSYITNLGNGDNNQYIVPANGYIWLHFTSINSALCYSQTSGGLTNYAQTFARYSGDGQLYAFFPVRKNDYFIVQIYTSSTAVVQNAYFIPCQGNV